MKQQTVHLGYEVGTGKPVEVPIAHMCVTGQTQLSGKTTTLAALVLRSGVTAIAFATKRGEAAFGLSQLDFEKKEVWTQPFFRHKAGWQHVSDILGAVLNEKLKFERSWIMKVSRGAKTLNDVHQNVKDWLAKPKLRSLDESVLTTIDEYFELFMPELVHLPYSDYLLLEDGALNVMDLTSYSTPLQMLVIASVFDEVYKHRNNVAVIVPEAWEFVPNNKNSPVKSAAVTLVRKGGVLKNFIWLDSQDLASVDTEIRRACSVWILGVQREQNEVKRLLSHIPSGTKKPKVEDVMQLEKGQFYVCYGKELHKTYVQPAWMSDEQAGHIAMGDFAWSLDVSPPKRPVPSTPPKEAQWEITGRVPSVDHPSGYALKVERVNSETGVRAAGMPDPSTVELRVCDDNLKPATREALIETAKKAGLAVPDGVIPDPDVAPGRAVNVGDGWRVSPVDLKDFARPPAGVEVQIDDGVGKTTFIQPGETDVTDQEREQYDRTIDILQSQLIALKQRIGEPLIPSEISFLETHKPHPLSQAEGSLDAKPKYSPSKHLYDVVSLFSDIMRSEPTLKQLAAAIIPYLPTNGVVKVEPREVVLREFQTAEVDRILSGFTQATTWQKSVVRYLHAKGSNANYAQLVRAIKGKEQNQMSGQQNKQMKEEMKGLVAVGVLRLDSAGRYYPELNKMVKDRLSSFNATDKDVEEVIGQVLLKVK